MVHLGLLSVGVLDAERLLVITLGCLVVVVLQRGDVGSVVSAFVQTHPHAGQGVVVPLFLVKGVEAFLGRRRPVPFLGLVTFHELRFVFGLQLCLWWGRI